ncbi:putative membrane protein [Hymenobacter sp. UYAg731]
MARSHLFQALGYVGRLPTQVRFVAAVVLGLAGYAAAPAELTTAGRAVVAWDAFAGGSLLLLWPLMLTADAGQTRVVAARESPGALVSFGFVPLALASSLAAVVLLLSTGMMPTLPIAMRVMHVALAVGGVAAAWLLLHTVFALRYACLYYYGTSAPGGLTFPEGSPPPRYLDFAYFAFVIGMTAQTADVCIYDPTLRATVLVHGLLAFAFNTAVVALSISGLVGVL